MSRVYCYGSKHYDRPRRLGGRALSPSETEIIAEVEDRDVCCERGADGNIVASCDLHDGPDRVHNHRWLVDRDNVTGLLSRDQTSPF
jgi:hypothetical protein